MLVEKNAKGKDFELTNRMNVVLIRDKQQIFLITAYPGKYAPPLPDKDKLSETEYQISLDFWNRYKISSFSKFEKEEGKYLEMSK